MKSLLLDYNPLNPTGSIEDNFYDANQTATKQNEQAGWLSSVSPIKAKQGFSATSTYFTI